MTLFKIKYSTLVSALDNWKLEYAFLIVYFLVFVTERRNNWNWNLKNCTALLYLYKFGTLKNICKPPSIGLLSALSTSAQCHTDNVIFMFFVEHIHSYSTFSYMPKVSVWVRAVTAFGRFVFSLLFPFLFVLFLLLVILLLLPLFAAVLVGRGGALWIGGWWRRGGVLEQLLELLNSGFFFVSFVFSYQVIHGIFMSHSKLF